MSLTKAKMFWVIDALENKQEPLKTSQQFAGKAKSLT
jgi:hypothetical protein